jgi:hypothetical protein
MLVISGGGGAFLHPTHCLGGKRLTSVAGTNGALHPVFNVFYVFYDQYICPIYGTY